MSKKIQVTITKDGAKMEAIGFAGTGCVQAIEALTAHMSGKASQPEHTPDYDAAPVQTENEVG